MLGDAHAWVDAIVHCPHHPERGFAGERPELKVPCTCRKPAPGLLARVSEDLPVDQGRAAFVGDSWRDMAAAHAFGAAAIGVRTGSGLRPAPPPEHAVDGRPDVVVDDLAAAAALLLDPDPAVEALADAIAARIDDAPLVVRLGGLSCAGKSITALRLRFALRARGKGSVRVAMDDWIVPHADRPSDSTARQRYPIEAISVSIEAILAGETVQAPGYDPRTRQRTSAPVEYALGDAEVLIVDGVLALDLPGDDALAVHVCAPSEEERRTRVAKVYADKGFTEQQTAALLAELEEEHETVTVLRRRAGVVLEPRPIAGGQEEPRPIAGGQEETG
jgi:uridine kinase